MLKAEHQVRAILRDLDIPHEIRNHRRHRTIFLNGQPVAIIPHGNRNAKGYLITQIRRVAEKMARSVP